MHPIAKQVMMEGYPESGLVSWQWTIPLDTCNISHSSNGTDEFYNLYWNSQLNLGENVEITQMGQITFRCLLIDSIQKYATNAQIIVLSDDDTTLNEQPHFEFSLKLENYLEYV